MAKPVFGSDNPLTYTEVHAAILGVVVGVLAGYAHGIGLTSAAASVTGFFVAAALGVAYNGEIPAAGRTVRREPWYALAALLAGGAAVLFVI